ncbi:RxLR effector protein [Phytophthora megakarya]|uniref:RxLR effector protein n=1 Tax=Phytophthora megakarya TaxID=4795 RepID=A0A225WSC7_9STRA|nr:RxLR effector protein [Phytophthora megakarya]
MRFSVFIVLLFTTFVACGSSFVSARNVVNNVNDRRLRAEAPPIPVGAVKAVANPAQVKAVVNAGTRLNEKLILMRAVKQALAAKGDEAAVKAAIQMAANARTAAKVSDEQASKLVSQLVVEGVKKAPKSWPRLRKFVKIALGAQVGALALYGAYKLLTKGDAATVAPTTTTGSA